jgi:hypothetical protein
MRRIAAAALGLVLTLSGCTGPFFYHEVIVPTDPNKHPPAATARP